MEEVSEAKDISGPVKQPKEAESRMKFLYKIQWFVIVQNSGLNFQDGNLLAE